MHTVSKIMKNLGKWALGIREWGLKVALITSGLVWLLLMASSWAESAQAADGSGSDDDYNFSWLDPDKKIYVLQNRKFRKEGRLMLSGLAGPGFNSNYRNGFNFEPRLGYYFHEEWGIEAFYTHTANSYNALYDGLAATGATIPSIREIRSQFGLLLNWSPWYAKINVFNSILYFDWYFQGGLGQLTSAVNRRTSATAADQFTTENLMAVYLGTGQQFHLSRSFFVRLDFLLSLYSASISTSFPQKTLYSNLNFGVGAGVRF